MAEKSKRSKKKSKDYDSDSSDEEVTTYVKKELDKAMKQVWNMERYIWATTRPDTNRPAQLQKLARVLKFRL